MSDYILNLDPSKRSTDTIDFQTALRGKIVGQEEGVQALVDLYQVFRAGLNSPGRPVGNLLFLGPTGSGKTRIVEAAAEILFGEARAVIKIDVRNFSTRMKSPNSSALPRVSGPSRDASSDYPGIAGG